MTNVSVADQDACRDQVQRLVESAEKIKLQDPAAAERLLRQACERCRDLLGKFDEATWYCMLLLFQLIDERDNYREVRKHGGHAWTLVNIGGSAGKSGKFSFNAPGRYILFLE